MMIKHHSEPYNKDGNSDSFCTHLDMVVPILHDDYARIITTHPAVMVVLVLRAFLFVCIQHIIMGTMDLVVASIHCKSNHKTAAVN